MPHSQIILTSVLMSCDQMYIKMVVWSYSPCPLIMSSFSHKNVQMMPVAWPLCLDQNFHGFRAYGAHALQSRENFGRVRFLSVHLPDIFDYVCCLQCGPDVFFWSISLIIQFWQPNWVIKQQLSIHRSLGSFWYLSPIKPGHPVYMFIMQWKFC